MTVPPASALADPAARLGRRGVPTAVSLSAFAAAWLAFHPADLPVFAWFALAPWLALVAVLGVRRMIIPTILGMYLYHALRLSWVAEIAWPPILAIPLFGLPGTAVLLGALWFALRAKVPLVVAAPLALVSSDLFTERLIAVSWPSLGYSQWRWLEGLQSAATFRVFLVSGLLYAVNGALGALLADRIRGAPLSRRSLARHAAGLGALALAMHLHGATALASSVFPLGPRAIGLQPNIPQENRVHRRSEDLWREHFLVHERFAPPGFDPDLFVTPETTFFPVTTDSPAFDLPARLDGPVEVRPGDWRRARDLLPRGRGQVSVIGYVRRAKVAPFAERYDEDLDGYQEWNVAGVLSDGAALRGESKKRVLVPLGESLPGYGWLPFRDWIKARVIEVGGRVRSMTPGMGPHPRHELKTPRGTWYFGVNICYEMVFPREFRDLMRDGQAPDFLVNISNDGWYRESSELDLVHAAGRFRAIEVGRSLFRVSNTGISTLIDPQGRYLQTVSQDGRRKAVPGVLSGEIPLAAGKTPWVRYGDLPTALALGLGWALALFFALRGRRKHLACKLG